MFRKPEGPYHKLAALACLAAALFSSPNLFAQQAITLQDAVKTAIVSNPEVQARWNAFESSRHEQDVARGGYYPRVDLTTGIGREHLKQPNQAATSLTRTGTVLSLTQMIYDGQATRNEVSRLAYAKLVRYYELLDATESTALEAARAYLDVLRYRELSRLAQENYAQHEQVFAQIQQRVQAGVGRRVDLEQAGGRLALAQSNLLTEASNLHDVSARYQRIVGELPPGEMIAPALLDSGIPPTIEEVLRQAFQGSPTFNAAIENVRSAQADAQIRDSNFLPRVDLRARKDIANNDNGISGRRDDEVIELVLNYNLFKGGADKAQQRQYAARLMQAKDLRDKACRDLRQTVAIAYADIANLSRQLGYLDQHQLAIEKAREAYRKQFDIGQRTLLDLLDTENEYFQARRAYTNGSFDHAIAHARTLAGMGGLLQALDVAREGMPTLKELGQDRSTVDPESQCPAVAPPPALALPVEPAKPKVEAAPAPFAIAPPAAPAPAPTAPAPAAPPAETVQQALSGWASAWSSKDFPRYRGYYAKTFKPEDGKTLEQWASDRAVRLGKPGNITVGVSDLKIQTPEAGRAITEFRQAYASPSYRDEVVKRLDWVRDGDRWKIEREQVLSTLNASVPDAVKPIRKKKRAKKTAQSCDCN